MARNLRIQFPETIYHVINRGNYRHDLFIFASAVEEGVCITPLRLPLGAHALPDPETRCAREMLQST